MKLHKYKRLKPIKKQFKKELKCVFLFRHMIKRFREVYEPLLIKKFDIT